MGRARTLTGVFAGFSLLAGLGILSWPVDPVASKPGSAARISTPAPRPVVQDIVLARGHRELPPLPDSAPPLGAPEPEPPKPQPIDPCERPLEELALTEPESVEQVYFAPTDEKIVSLTFDDGPSATHTPKVLRTLAHYDVTATFFVLGERVAKMPEVTASIADAGHEIGNHTWSHRSLRSLWKSQIRDEVCRTNAAVHSATGRRPTLFRPPFGRFAPSALPLLGALGMDMVLWSADGTDWDTDDPAAIAARIVKEAKPGAIILLHDSNAVTVAALPLVIQGLRARGYEIRPVGETTGRSPYAD